MNVYKILGELNEQSDELARVLPDVIRSVNTEGSVDVSALYEGLKEVVSISVTLAEAIPDVFQTEFERDTFMAGVIVGMMSRQVLTDQQTTES